MRWSREERREADFCFSCSALTKPLAAVKLLEQSFVMLAVALCMMCFLKTPNLIVFANNCKIIEKEKVQPYMHAPKGLSVLQRQKIAYRGIPAKNSRPSELLVLDTTNISISYLNKTPLIIRREFLVQKILKEKALT